MRFLLFSLLIFSGTMALAADPSPYALACAEESLHAQSGLQLGLIGKFLKARLFPNDLHLETKAEERKFSLNHPEMAMIIRGAACRGIATSRALCGPNVQATDEEADAVRHFVFSSSIACGAGKQKALDYTTAHEGPLPWAADSKMDISNNAVGIEWANPDIGRCLNFSDKTVAKAALMNLKNKKLVTLKKGESLCADADSALKTLDAIDELEFKEAVDQQYLQIQGFLPALCGHAPKP